jgi:PleD family two-component response regulator
MTRERMLSRLREQADLVHRHVHPASIAMLHIDEFKADQ